MDRNQPHRGLWVSIGGVLILIMVGGMYQTPNALAFWVLICVGAIGAYAIVAPFTGLPLPQTRTAPLWHRDRVQTRTPNQVSQIQRPVVDTAAKGNARIMSRREYGIETFARLRGLISSNLTDVQNQAVLAPHLGLWRRVQGTVTDVSATGHASVGYTSLDLIEAGTDEHVHANFGGHSAAVMRLSKGSVVSVEGMLSHVADYGVMLWNCELITQ
jgi:hypothetical protein